MRNIPIISRARAYRLYTQKGSRIVDMYQNNGATILGHRALNLTKTIKNVISRGLISAMPSLFAKRLERNLLSIFKDYKSIRIYNSIQLLLQMASDYSMVTINEENIFDPGIFPTDSVYNGISYWRPFLPPDKEENILQSKLLIPILPFSICGIPQILCFKEDIKEKYPSSMISPFILAGAINSLHNLGKFDNYESNLAKDIDPEYWHLNNIYISPKFDEEIYTIVYERFLSEGVLLSPHYPGPSIIPSELSYNEKEKIQKLFFTYPGAFYANK